MRKPRPRRRGKVAVSLRDLMLRGEVAGVRPGATLRRVRRVLGEPGDFALPRQGCQILVYAGLELHFGPDSRLEMVFCDGFYDGIGLKGGAGFDVDRWVLTPGLRLAEYVAALREANVTYREQAIPYWEPEGVGVAVDVTEPSGTSVSRSFAGFHFDEGAAPGSGGPRLAMIQVSGP